MSLSHHHQNQLHLIQAGLLRSDPQLAARLSMFGRPCAGQAIPAWEQVPPRHDRIRQAAALIAETISALAPARRAGLTWPRLPAAAEVAIIGAGYLGYALVRLAVQAGRHAAFVHAAELWRAERWLHLDVEPSLNHLVAAGPALAEATGYYYGLLHFIVTPLVLGWLYLGRPPPSRRCPPPSFWPPPPPISVSRTAPAPP